jgi:DNA-binding MarR family transcriptional regulator
MSFREQNEPEIGVFEPTVLPEEFRSATTSSSTQTVDRTLSLSEKQILFIILRLEATDFSRCILTSIRLRNIEVAYEEYANSADGLLAKFMRANQSVKNLVESLIDKEMISKVETPISPHSPLLEITPEGKKALGWGIDFEANLTGLRHLENDLSIGAPK